MSTTTMGAATREAFRTMAWRSGDSLAIAGEVRGLAYTSGAGAVFLGRVRDRVLDAAQRFDDRGLSLDNDPDEQDRWDVIHESPNDDPVLRWHEYVELHAWSEDLAELGADDRSDVTESVAGGALRVIAGRLFDRLWGELREAARQDGEG